MTEYLFRLPDHTTGTLQSKIQEMMVDAIFAGQLSPGSALPSGRKLAGQLQVARNTVILAYQALSDEGFIESRERSGFYVCRDVLDGFAKKPAYQNNHANKTSSVDWSAKIIHRPSKLPFLQKPRNWQRYPYPFVCGQFDTALFPIADWRECCREASGIAAIHDWASDHVDRDRELLIDQVLNKLLPRRGIWAKREEIIITLGAQNALFIAAQLLLNPRRRIGMENPGYADARNVFLSMTDHMTLLDVDDQGLVANEKLIDCDCVYATPSHQYPTTVTMGVERRAQLLELANKHDIVLIEDDYESEFNYTEKPIPALKSLDSEGRVIYVGSVSKTIAPGLRLGYMVAPEPFIRQAIALRRIMVRHPPSNNQYIVAQFLKRGYHDALIRRISQTLHRRSSIMKIELDKYFPNSTKKSDFGGSSYWIRGEKGLDAFKLSQLAKANGILIETGTPSFYPGTEKVNYFRLGFSSISSAKIREGLPRLRQLISEIT